MVCGDSVGVSVAEGSGGGTGLGGGVMIGTVVDSGVGSNEESTGRVGTFAVCRVVIGLVGLEGLEQVVEATSEFPPPACADGAAGGT
jgi:hypothetical protein